MTRYFKGFLFVNSMERVKHYLPSERGPAIEGRFLETITKIKLFGVSETLILAGCVSLTLCMHSASKNLRLCHSDRN